MIRYAVIGTSPITKAFIAGAEATGKMHLQAIYSRDLQKAKDFSLPYGQDLHLYDDLEAMAKDPTIDAVYIASPNAYHSPQGKLFLTQGKHVLAEKACASNKKELEELLALAKEKNVVFMEAMKTLSMPGYVKMKELLGRLGPIRKYIGNYCQYSSRYDRHKAGERVNTFQRDFSNGSLLDIGIYPLYPALDLFGPPQFIKAQGTLLKEGGVDGSGSLLLQYEGLEVVITHSKISDSHMPSEIQGELGTLLIDRIGSPKVLTLYPRGGEREEYPVETCDADMVYEALEFVATIESARSFSSLYSDTLMLRVHSVLDEARRQMGLIYPADTR